MEKLENIEFDNEDQELFLIDDLELKAKAIRFSILPKLELIINYAISKIDKVYNISVFDDCMIAQAPHYRLNNREYGIKKDYHFARVSVRGKRGLGRWHGVRKINGAELQVSPFSLDVKINQYGLFVSLVNTNQQLSKESNKKIFNFLLENDTVINVIQKTTGVFDYRIHTGKEWLTSNKKWLESKLKNNDFDVSMYSDNLFYPLKFDQLRLVIDKLILLYPIFHSYLQIAKGEEIVFDTLVGKSGEWVVQKINEGERQTMDIKVNINAAIEKAETKIKVMPGIRWQVFQRDDWRCVACGIKAVENDTVILHVDHIIPRSLGGMDKIDNYQTLCDRCNIGKSNTDKTDLRKKQNRITERTSE